MHEPFRYVPRMSLLNPTETTALLAALNAVGPLHFTELRAFYDQDEGYDLLVLALKPGAEHDPGEFEWSDVRPLREATTAWLTEHHPSWLENRNLWLDFTNQHSPGNPLKHF